MMPADAKEPKGFVQVEKGKMTAKKPKKPRKGVAHCIRVDQQGSTKAAQFKLVRARLLLLTRSPHLSQHRVDIPVANEIIQVLGAESDDELRAWEASLSRFSQGI
jgi:hypothetical protein